MKHHELKTHLRTVLGSRILDMYSQGVFAKAPRLGIDLAVFETLLKSYLAEIKSPAYSLDWDAIDWYLITRAEIADFAGRLGISEARTLSLIEQCAREDFLPPLSDDEAIALIEELLEMSRPKAADLTRGKVPLYVPNALTRKAILEYLTRKGFLSQYAYRGDVLLLCLVDLISLFHYYYDCEGDKFCAAADPGTSCGAVAEAKAADPDPGATTDHQIGISCEALVDEITFQQCVFIKVVMDKLAGLAQAGTSLSDILQNLPKSAQQAGSVEPAI